MAGGTHTAGDQTGRDSKTDEENVIFSDRLELTKPEIESAGENQKRMQVVVERQTGATMMEQLVPEIMTDTLSYLDYLSLCQLSMTNSSMRRAVNDDSVWKSLYHKDFTAEQDNVTPVNGWKAYYAATRAVLNANTEFFKIIREKSLPAMNRLWLRADYTRCSHGSGALYVGYDAIMESWKMVFNFGPDVPFEVQDVQAHVLTDMAWVTMKNYIDMLGFGPLHVGLGPLHVINVYELHKGKWYMVHHHGTLIIPGVDVAHQNWEFFFP